jgi:BlaI family penicillinase repressor
MAKGRRLAMSEAEADVLRVLWEHGPGTVREIQDLLAGRPRKWSRSTVITLLQRLEKKQYVASDQGGFAFVFRAIASKEDVLQERLQEVAEELYQGEPAPLVLAFAERHRFTAEEVAQFRTMIEQIERQTKRRKSKG